MYPYKNLQDLTETQLWLVIADKIACLSGCTVPPNMQKWNKKQIMEWVAENISSISV
jgi:hypothetical protein